MQPAFRLRAPTRAAHRGGRNFLTSCCWTQESSAIHRSADRLGMSSYSPPRRTLKVLGSGASMPGPSRTNSVMETPAFEIQRDASADSTVKERAALPSRPAVVAGSIKVGCKFSEPTKHHAGSSAATLLRSICSNAGSNLLSSYD